MNLDRLLNVVGKGDGIEGLIKGFFNSNDFLNQIGVNTEESFKPIHYTFNRSVVTLQNPIDSTKNFTTGTQSTKVPNLYTTGTGSTSDQILSINSESEPLLDTNGVELRQPTGVVFVYPGDYDAIKESYNFDSFGNILDIKGNKFRMFAFHQQTGITTTILDGDVPIYEVSPYIKSMNLIGIPKECAAIIAGHKINFTTIPILSILIDIIYTLDFFGHTYYEPPYLFFKTLYSKDNTQNSDNTFSSTDSGYYYDANFFQLLSDNSFIYHGVENNKDDKYYCFFRNETGDSMEISLSDDIKATKKGTYVSDSCDGFGNDVICTKVTDALNAIVDLNDASKLPSYKLTLYSRFLSITFIKTEVANYVICGAIGKFGGAANALNIADIFGSETGGLWLSSIPDGNNEIDETTGEFKYHPIYHFYRIDNWGTIYRTNIIITQPALNRLNKLHSELISKQTK